MPEATLSVSGIYPIKNERGKEMLVSFLIEKGVMTTIHSPGEVAYYNLNMSDGKIYRVMIVDAYCKKTREYLEVGHYVSFYFPLNIEVPALGLQCTVKSPRLAKSLK